MERRKDKYSLTSSSRVLWLDEEAVTPRAYATLRQLFQFRPTKHRPKYSPTQMIKLPSFSPKVSQCTVPWRISVIRYSNCSNLSNSEITSDWHVSVYNINIACSLRFLRFIKYLILQFSFSSIYNERKQRIDNATGRWRKRYAGRKRKERRNRRI